MKKYLLIALAVVLVGAVGVTWYTAYRSVEAINSFEDCAEAGYPVMESYPARCRTPDGRTFTQLIAPTAAVSPPLADKSDLIRVTSPQPGQVVTSPLMVTGQARGTWFFEASFPVHLEDASGKRLVSTPAQAQDEWMTTEFVPFQAELEIPLGVTGEATLVLEKDNPSGLPEHADSLRMPIVISPAR